MTPLTHLILLALADRSRHGYAIMKEIERLSEGSVTPRAGSLYAALDRMTGEGMIQEAPDAGGPDADARRVYFRMTDGGRDALDRETMRMARLLHAAQAKRPAAGLPFTLALEDA